MHLTRYTDYAIRVLLYLAVKGEERTTINEIAKTFSISRNHLMKIVQELNQKGYLTAIRGKNGGLLLGRRPETISLGALVRDTEHEMALVGSIYACRLVSRSYFTALNADAYSHPHRSQLAAKYSNTYFPLCLS